MEIKIQLSQKPTEEISCHYAVLKPFLIIFSLIGETVPNKTNFCLSPSENAFTINN